MPGGAATPHALGARRSSILFSLGIVLQALRIVGADANLTGDEGDGIANLSATLEHSRATSSIAAATTGQPTTTLPPLGALGEVACTPTVRNIVLYGVPSETQRLIIIGEAVDCTAYGAGLLQVALQLGRPEVAVLLAQNYSARSWQLLARNGTGATALLMAADQGFADVVKELILKGVDVLVTDDSNHTALHLAAVWPDIVPRLLDAAPDPSVLLTARDSMGDQPLHRALKQRSSAAARAMLEGAMSLLGPDVTGALVRSADSSGDHPVHLNGDPDILELLAECGADLHARNGGGAMPLHTVARMNSTAARGTLGLAAAAARAAHGGIDVRDSAGRTPLHYAALGGITENCLWLIQRGADTGARDDAGDLPLSLGLRASHWQIVEVFALGRTPPLQAVVLLRNMEMLRYLVLNQSLPADTVDADTGRGAIFTAAETGQDEMLGFLLAQGVSIDSIDAAGLTILSAAVMARHAGTAAFLLKHGAAVDQRLQNDSTVLHVATALGALPEVDVLLQAGASVNSADHRGKTPLHDCPSASVAETLLRYGAQPISSGLGLQPLHTAALAGRVEVMRTLLLWRHGEVDAQAANGDTPLHVAALSGSADAVELLLRWCADSQARNAAGRLASMYAADGRVAATIRDSSLFAGRCQCDCGPYTPGPLFATFGWRGGCNASVKCQLHGYSHATEHATEQVQCLPQESLAEGGVKSAWSPARPSMQCHAALSAAPGPGPRLLPLLLPCLAALVAQHLELRRLGTEPGHSKGVVRAAESPALVPGVTHFS